MIVYPCARVRIYTNEPLATVASFLSEQLFSRLPFGVKELAMFDEVPALRLEGNVMGLFVAVHGYSGEYTLVIEPTAKTMSDEHGVPTDISNYVALLIRLTANWRVEIPKA